MGSKDDRKIINLQISKNFNNWSRKSNKHEGDTCFLNRRHLSRRGTVYKGQWNLRTQRVMTGSLGAMVAGGQEGEWELHLTCPTRIKSCWHDSILCLPQHSKSYACFSVLNLCLHSENCMWKNVHILFPTVGCIPAPVLNLWWRSSKDKLKQDKLYLIKIFLEIKHTHYFYFFDSLHRSFSEITKKDPDKSQQPTTEKLNSRTVSQETSRICSTKLL